MDTNTTTDLKQKILIVDDEIDLANLYRMRLIQEGYEVEHCADGESALQQAREFKPDLIMLDLMMPRLSGFDSIDLFKNMAETHYTKIVILSALSQPDDVAKAKSLGADDYLVKSDSDINTVVERINQLMKTEKTEFSLPDIGATS